MGEAETDVRIIPLRLGDLDTNAHVNNVSIVELAQEAGGRLPWNPVPRPERGAIQEVDYLAPVLPQEKAIAVHSRTAGGDLVQELRSVDGTDLFARILTRPRPSLRATSIPPGALAFTVHSRDSDSHESVVLATSQAAYLQEARIDWMTRMRAATSSRGPVLVVRSEINFAIPLDAQEAPFSGWVWLESFRRTSMVLAGVIEQDGVAQTTMRTVQVGVTDGRTRPFDATEIAYLEGTLIDGVSGRIVQSSI